MSPIFPSSYWDHEVPIANIGGLISRVSSLSLNYPPQLIHVSPAQPPHAEQISIFNVLALIQKDDSLSAKALNLNKVDLGVIHQVVGNLHETILKKAFFTSLANRLLIRH
jgi:hypothetical protein